MQADPCVIVVHRPRAPLFARGYDAGPRQSQVAGMMPQGQTCRTRAPVDNVLVAPVERDMDITVQYYYLNVHCGAEKSASGSPQLGYKTTHLRSSPSVSRYQLCYTCTKHFDSMQ